VASTRKSEVRRVKGEGFAGESFSVTLQLALAANSTFAEAHRRSGRLDEAGELAVVEAGKEELGGDGAEEGEGHVFLGVPDIALGAEEGGALVAGVDGDGPFEELVEGADGEAGGDGEGEEPAASADDSAAEVDFAGGDGGDEALGEVAEAVVVVAGESEGVLGPGAQGDEGVGVVAADDEDEGVEEEEDAEEGGEGEAVAGGEEEGYAEEGGEDFEPPGEVVVRVDGGPEEGRGEEEEEPRAEGAEEGVRHRSLGRLSYAQIIEPTRELTSRPAETT